MFSRPLPPFKGGALFGLVIMAIILISVLAGLVPAKGPETIGSRELDITFPEHGGTNTSFTVDVPESGVVLSASLEIKVEEKIYFPKSKTMTIKEQAEDARAWKGILNVNLTSLDPVALRSIETDTVARTNITSSDDKRWKKEATPPWQTDNASQPIGEYPYHHFEFNLTSGDNMLDILDFYWEGYGLVDDGNVTMNCSASLYIWYDLTSSWLYSTGYNDVCSGPEDKDLGFFYDFMGVGGLSKPDFVNVLIIGDWDADAVKTTLATDFVRLNTTTHERNFPNDLAVDVNDDGEIEHVFEGIVNTTQTFGSGEGLVEALQRAINDTENSLSSIPINFTSSTGGKITVELKELDMDLPPVTEIDLEDVKMLEDGLFSGAYDLHDNFIDDNGDTNLTFAIVWEEMPDKVHAEIREGHLVDLSTVEANWSGEVRFRFSATDKYNQTVESNNVTVTVDPVNDRPVLEAIGDITAFENKQFNLFVTATDTDEDDTLTFRDDTDLFDIDRDTGLINFRPTIDDIGEWIVNVSVTDVNGSVDFEVITVSVMNVNDPPVVTLYLPTNDFILSLNKVKLIWQGNDLDDDELTYDLFIDTGSGLVLKAGGLTATEYDLSDLMNGTTYRWTVEAWDGVLRSNRPEAFAFTYLEEGGSQLNQPPSVTLLSPSKDSTVGTLFPTLTWQSYDPDGDDLSYDVIVYDMDGNIIIQTLATSTYHKLTIPLTNEEGYLWTVIPFDGLNQGICVSGKWSFTVNRTSGQESSAPIVNVTVSPKGTIERGALVTFDASAAYDPDGTIVLFIWTFGDGTTFTGSQHQVVEHIFEDGGDYEVSLVVFDDDGKTSIWTDTIEVKKVKQDDPGIIGLSMSQLVIIMVITSLVVTIISLTVYMAYRRMKYERYTVEEAFLVYRDGRLMRNVKGKHEKNDDEEELPDSEILGSMLTAVQDFIKDTMRDRKGTRSLRVLEYGDKKIVLERGKYTFLAVFLKGKVTEEFRAKMKKAIKKIETGNYKILRKWDGNLNELWGIGPALNLVMVEGYLDLDEDKEKEGIE